MYIHLVYIMSSVGVYFRVDRRLLEEFTRTARSLGMSRSEALRRAMELFLEVHGKDTATRKLRGLVRSRLSLRDLDEVYMVHGK